VAVSLPGELVIGQDVRPESSLSIRAGILAMVKAASGSIAAPWRGVMPRIRSAHSFRGRTGKSKSTGNPATLISRAGKRVGVVGAEIHSPGIHVTLGLKEEAVRNALNDYLWGASGSTWPPATWS
jgi:Mrp family chromosome partitioning ATPase